jgi:ABC-type amino acid transport substrate-binding protein
MDEQVTRADLLKAAGLVTAGSSALALALASPAGAQAVPQSAYLQAYVTIGTPELPSPLLVQAAAFQVPVVGTGPVAALGADPSTGVPGIGFDIDLAAPVAGSNRDKNKGENPSYCTFTLDKGGFNGFPPINSGGVDAIRLEGTVTEAADPANLGVPVKVHGASAALITPGHNVCLIRFFFGPFGPWVGRGLAIVNT